MQPCVTAASRRRYRILNLLPFPPRLDSPHGGGKVAAQLLVQCAARHDVAAVYIADPGEAGIDGLAESRTSASIRVDRKGQPARNKWVTAVETVTEAAAGRPRWATLCRGSAMEREIRNSIRGFRPDIVQMHCSVMAQYASLATEHRIPSILIDYECALDDRDEMLGLSGARRLLAMLQAAVWRRFQSASYKAVDSVVTFTDRDRDYVRRLSPRTRITVIPIGAELAQRTPAAAASGHGVLFIGNFMHAPNVDAGTRLVRAIFPAIRGRCPKATLTVVGANPPADLRSAAIPGVTVTGAVPDVDPYIREAAVVVAPIRIGGGMRVKVLEALAAGKAVVATPLAVEGVPVQHGGTVLIGETDMDLADHVVRLLNDPGLRARLERQAYALARTRLGWGRCIDAFDSHYDEITRSC